MTPRAACAIAALCLGAASCKDPGTLVVDVELPGACASATQVVAYAIPDAACGEVACGKYADACDAGCTLVCGEGCPLEALDVRPPPGRYALVIDYYDDAGLAVATACAQLTVDADGTSDATVAAEAACCGP